jgi:hypothetical protein
MRNSKSKKVKKKSKPPMERRYWYYCSHCGKESEPIAREIGTNEQIKCFFCKTFNYDYKNRQIWKNICSDMFVIKDETNEENSIDVGTSWKSPYRQTHDFDPDYEYVE